LAKDLTLTESAPSLFRDAPEAMVTPRPLIVPVWRSKAPASRLKTPPSVNVPESAMVAFASSMVR